MGRWYFQLCLSGSQCTRGLHYTGPQFSTPPKHPDWSMYSQQWRIQDFPEAGAPTPRGGPTYDFAKFTQKLHEIERIWAPGGVLPRAPLRSATGQLVSSWHPTGMLSCYCTGQYGIQDFLEEGTVLYNFYQKLHKNFKMADTGTITRKL